MTEEGGSLITDIRILRALFAEGDEHVVYAPGGGLSEPWSGEQDDDDTSSNSEDSPSGYPSLDNLRIGRGRPLSNNANDTSAAWDVFDDSADWENVQPSSSDDVDEDETEEEKTLFASGRRLFKCLQLDLSSFGLEKAGLAHQFATLITKEKINLLYSSTFRFVFLLNAHFSLSYARNCSDEKLTLKCCSFGFSRTANILVAKRHIRKARNALESASR